MAPAATLTLAASAVVDTGALWANFVKRASIMALNRPGFSGAAPPGGAGFG